MLRFQQRVVERRQEHLADELVHQLAAAAMSHQDVRVLLDGDGAGGIEFHKNSKMKTSNIQHPTLNIECRVPDRSNEFGCSMFDVGCWMFLHGYG
jgi:hypothetical protein